MDAENMAAPTGAGVEIEYERHRRALDDAEQIVTLRIEREALRNVRKHAAASRVNVSARQGRHAWLVEVRVAGRGLDIDAHESGSHRSFVLHIHA